MSNSRQTNANMGHSDPIKLNLIDRAVRYLNPSAGIERVRSRAVFSRLEEHGFITGGSSKRSMRGWNPPEQTADQDIIPKQSSMRASSRDLYMNTPLATGAIRRLKSNAIGFGLRLQCRIDRETLGLSDEKADAWEMNTEREWLSYSESIECDASRTLKFPQLTSQAFFSTLLNGDTFTLLPKIPRTGQVYDTRIHLVEGDYVCNPSFLMDTIAIAGGVEIDEWGAPIAYHFRKAMPHSQIDFGAYGVNKWERIPVYGETSGRQQVFHLFDKERPGQRRGFPFVTPVVDELKQITRLSKAEIEAAIINSYFTVFVKSNSPVADIMGGGYVPPSSDYSPGTSGTSILNEDDARDEKLYEMGKGNIIEMDPDESIEIADPKRPNANFEPFFLAIVKQIGSAINIPFEQLMLHFNSSYSASRAAIQEAWKFYRERRLWASDYFCQPIYTEWMVEAILKGRIVAPGFFSDPVIQSAWLGSVWIGPGQGQLDPLRETKASVMRINNFLTTYEDEYVSLTGKDWRGGVNRRSREEELLKEKDLKPEIVENTTAEQVVEAMADETT